MFSYRRSGSSDRATYWHACFREGAHEDLIVEIPKGHYLPVFQTRGRAKEIASQAPAAKKFDDLQVEPRPRLPAAQPLRAARPYWLAIAIGLVIVSFVALAFRLQPKRVTPKTATEVLWQPFFSADPPLVIYSNGLFEGDSKNGLRYARAVDKERPLTEHYVDTYTGVGEVMAVHQLTKLFDANHANFILKRSLLVTWDEAKLKNLIFIGSAAENPSLTVLPTTTEFTMRSDKDSAGIVNHHPRPGEPAEYWRPEHPLTKDYAVVALLPGPEPETKMLLLSGLTTLGTEAAAEFACKPETAATLLKAAALPSGGLRPFEAVLETTIKDDVPLETKLVTIHLR